MMRKTLTNMKMKKRRKNGVMSSRLPVEHNSCVHVCVCMGKHP